MASRSWCAPARSSSRGVRARRRKCGRGRSQVEKERMPDDTRELITAAEFSHWLVIAAFVALVVSIAVGAVWVARRKSSASGMLRGVAAGMMGPAAMLLWHVYNRIEDRYGLDSVRALLLNL